MPEPTPGQVPTTTTTPAADPQAQPTTPATAPTTATTTPEPKPEPEEKFSAEYVKQLRAEAAEHRKRRQELEARVKAEDDAKLSEIERAKKEAADTGTLLAQAKADLRKALIAQSVASTAAKMNLDAELASELVKESMLTIGDDGKPTDTEAVLKGLIKKWPYLVKAAPPVGINAGEGTGAASPPNDPKAREQELRAKFKF